MISVITINYNNREGLRRTIESVINQTWRDFEYIIIDGGSTDGSRELIEQYKEHLSYWCSEPDKGIYNAMNKGIRHAKGEYLNFMNSGDTFYDNEVLEKVFKEERKADILYGYMIDDKSKTIVNKALMKSVLYWDDFVGNTLPHQSTFSKKHLFDDFGYFDETYKIVADSKFFIKSIVWEKVSYEFIPDIISVYEGGGISDSSILFEERDVRLRSEMFPKMVIDDYSFVSMCRNVKKYSILRKCFTLLSIIANKLNSINLSRRSCS